MAARPNAVIWLLSEDHIRCIALNFDHGILSLTIFGFYSDTSMAFPSQRSTETYEANNRVQDTAELGGLSSEATLIEDVLVPAQLLRATSNVGSPRDTTNHITSQTQSAVPYFNEGGFRSLSRRDTQIPGSIERSMTLPDSRRRPNTKKRPTRGQSHDETKRSGPKSGFSSSAIEHQDQPGPSRIRSYVQGSNDFLSVSRTALLNTSGQGTNASSIWSTSDPFSTRHNASPSEALGTYGHSCSPDTSNAGLNVGPSSDGQQPRRGTLQSVVDAFVPDIFHRRFTNSSYLRKSSIWQTYEKAKMQSIQLQRKRWVQLTFEYGFYATLILFTYFILVGVPLWSGAVYWLWWVIAHKFVIAGGFGVTVGTAFL
jgi:hypothetical protein